MEKIRQLGAFFGMLWQIFFSEKFAKKVEEINFANLQKVMDEKDKTGFVDNLIKFINYDFKFVISERMAQIWKSIDIGGMKATKLMEKNKQKGFLLGSEAEFMTKSKAFKTSAKTTTIDFAMKPLKDFGFTGKTFKEAQEFFRNHPMYEFCQPEDVYYLRQEYSDQPKGEWIRLMMDTVADSCGDPRMFGLGHNVHGLWVYSRWSFPDRVLDPASLWVVRVRK